MIAVAIAGCGGTDDQGRPAVELSAFTLPLDPPARAMAVFAEPARDRISIVLADEITSRVQLYVTGIADTTLVAPDGGGFAGLGPRAIVALDGRIVTADSVAKTLTVLTVDGSALTKQHTITLDDSPMSLLVLDPEHDGGGQLLVVVGTGAASKVQLWRQDTDGSLALSRSFDVPDVTEVGLSSDGSAMAVQRTRGTGTWLLTYDGDLAPAGTVALCANPRAPIPYGEGVAVACDDGVTMIRSLTLFITGTIDFSGILYGLAAGDLDGDGIVDLAGVDLAAHQLVIWPGAGGAPQLHPVSRGPITLALSDLDSDGDLDVLVLAFEAHALDVLLNQGGETP